MNRSAIVPPTIELPTLAAIPCYHKPCLFVSLTNQRAAKRPAKFEVTACGMKSSTPLQSAMISAQLTISKSLGRLDSAQTDVRHVDIYLTYHFRKRGKHKRRERYRKHINSGGEHEAVGRHSKMCASKL